MYKMKLIRLLLVTILILYFHNRLLADTFTNNNITYEIISSTDKTVKVTACATTSSTLTIPKTVTNNNTTYTVTTLGAGSISGLSIKDLYIEYISQIENGAIADCSSLKMIFFYDEIEPDEIAKPFWSNCPSLANYSVRKYAEATSKIRSSKSSVNEYMLYAVRDLDGNVTCKDILAVPPAYGNSSYTSASKSFTASGTKIYPYAFYQNTFITYMTIGKSVREVGEYAFASSSITGCRDNSTAKSETWGQSTFASSNLKNISWAATGEACPLKEIPNNCFEFCPYLQTITIPASVLTIGSYAFRSNMHICNGDFNTPLTEVEILGNNLKSIESYAFYHCEKLATITIPSSISSIGISAFEECTSLSDLIFSDNTTNEINTIYYRAFYNCEQLKSFFVTTKINSLGDYAFYNCKNMTKFEFKDASSTSNTLYSIPRSCFENSNSLSEINIPYSVVRIDNGAFSSSGLYSVTFNGNLLQVINEAAFYNCSSLRNVKLPTSLYSIARLAFAQCWRIGTIDFINCTTLYSIGDNAFYGCKYYGDINTYHLILKNGLPPNIKTIGDLAFADSYVYCPDNYIIIPRSVTSIGMNPFADHYYLQYFIVNSPNFKCQDDVLFTADMTRLICYPNKLGYNTSRPVSEKRGYIVPPTVTTIDRFAFMRNIDLKHVVLPSSITKIPSGLFANCTALESITIPSSVNTIETAAFWGCSNLKEVFSMAVTPPTFSETGIDHGQDGYEGFLNTYKQFEGVTNCTLYTKINTTSTSTLDLYKADENYKSVFKEITPYIPITVGSTGYLTLARDFDVYLNSNHPDTKYGLIPYAVKSFNASTATVTLKQVKPNQNSTGWTADDIYIPSRMKSDGIDQVYNGVLLKGEPGFTYYVRMGTGDYNTTSWRWTLPDDFTNMLKPSVVETRISPAEGDYTNFVLKDGKFRKVSAIGSVPFNRAYLSLPTSEVKKMDQYNNGSKALSVVFEDEELPTAIDAITVNEERISDGSYYTLSGVRVKCPGKGVYIRNGKKVVIK